MTEKEDFISKANKGCFIDLPYDCIATIATYFSSKEDFMELVILYRGLYENLTTEHSWAAQNIEFIVDRNLFGISDSLETSKCN